MRTDDLWCRGHMVQTFSLLLYGRLASSKAVALPFALPNCQMYAQSSSRLFVFVIPQIHILIKRYGHGTIVLRANIDSNNANRILNVNLAYFTIENQYFLLKYHRY
jgi:hypothetical protein